MKHSANTDIGDFIREKEALYQSGSPVKLSEHVEWNLKDHIANVEAYKYSKHLSGSVDSKGREKPFFNIGTAVANLWYRATDIDRRNIRNKAAKIEDIVLSFAANEKLQEFMRKDHFGSTLNKWGRTLSDYGSAVLKSVEKDSQLHVVVMPWSKLIVDQVNFQSAPVIEILELTADQLLQRKGYDKETVQSLIAARAARETEKGQDKDQNNDFIKLYEVHGMMPKSYRTSNEDDMYEYEQLMFVVSFVKGNEKGAYDDFILASGREDKSPYMITHLIEEEGRVMGMGAYEHVFEAQWMTNHTAKSIKDQLDLASKLVFQTADPSFVGLNALQAIETGDILIHSPNAPLSAVANNSHDINALQSYGQQWESLAKEITSTPDAIRGDTMPSGTAYRSVAIQNRESHSLFELMTENKGLALEELMRVYVLPYIKKQLKNSDQIATILDGQGIEFIDPKYIRYETGKRTRKAVADILKQGEFDQLSTVDSQDYEADIKGELAELGNQRFLKPSEISEEQWDTVLKDMEWDLIVEVTNENTDKEATLTTLTTVLTSIASNPAILQDPNASLLFNKILEETGRVSPIELARTQAPVAPQQTDMSALTPEPAT